MREVLTLNRTIHVNTRIPLGTTMSLGELFSLMEDHVKIEFFNHILSKIRFGKQYTFHIEVISNELLEDTIRMDYGIIRETFQFTMFELEDDDVIVKERREYVSFPDLALREYLDD